MAAVLGDDDQALHRHGEEETGAVVDAGGLVYRPRFLRLEVGRLECV